MLNGKCNIIKLQNLQTALASITEMVSVPNHATCMRKSVKLANPSCPIKPHKPGFPLKWQNQKSGLFQHH